MDLVQNQWWTFQPSVSLDHASTQTTITDENTSVTLGMVAAGQLNWIRAIVLFPAQLLGSMVAAGLVSAILPGDIKATRTALAPGMSEAQGVFFEMFLTSFLVFTVLMLAAEKSKTTFLAPIGIGLALFVAELAGKLLFSDLLLFSTLTQIARCLLYRR
jgi:glycerol uptake facilitator-like aquaporin